MGTWQITDQFLFFTDRDTLLPVLQFSLLWNTAALSQCVPGQGVFTSVQLYQRRPVICWWGAAGFSIPITGDIKGPQKSCWRLCWSQYDSMPLSTSPDAVPREHGGPAGVGLYGMPEASSQSDTGEVEVQSSDTELPGTESMGEASTPHSTREDEQEGTRIPPRRCLCRGKCWSPLQQWWVQDSGWVNSTLV